MQSAGQLSATARRAINSTGGRMTSQRRTLLRIIQDSEDHLDAEEIHRRAHQQGEQVSLSTVYRTLDLLKRLELVDELHLWDEHHHYEKTEREHCHLVCQVCGDVTEISGKVVERMKALAGSSEGFNIERAQMDFVGTCRRCQAGEGLG